MHKVATLMFLGFAVAATARTASAEGMSGEEMRNVVAGNTLMLRANNQRYWAYYKEDGAAFVKSDQGMTDTGTWRVTADGQFCVKWQVIRKGNEACWKNARLEGKMLRLQGIDGAADTVSELSKGNSQGF